MPTELPTSPVSETDEVETARGPKVWSGPGMGDSSVNMWIQSAKKGSSADSACTDPIEFHHSTV